MLLAIDVRPTPALVRLTKPSNERPVQCLAHQGVNGSMVRSNDFSRFDLVTRLKSLLQTIGLLTPQGPSKFSRALCYSCWKTEVGSSSLNVVSKILNFSWMKLATVLAAS